MASPLNVPAAVADLHVTEFTSNGPPVLFLHGVLRRGDSFLPLVPWLSSAWKLSAVDLRGHGRSPHGCHSYFVRDYVQDIAALVRQRWSSPVALYGHSLGAMVAAGVAAAVPELVAAVILEDPPCETLSTRLASTPWLAYFRSVQQLAQAKLPVPELARQLADIVMQDPLSGRTWRLGDVRDAAQLRYQATCLAAVDPAVLTPLVAGAWLTDYSLLDLAPRITCPALILQADEAAGGMLMSDDAQQLLNHLQDGLLVRLPGVPHLMHGTRPQEVASVMIPFLTAVTPPSPLS